MTMNVSTYLADKLARHFLKGSAFTRPTLHACFGRMSTGAPDNRTELLIPRLALPNTWAYHGTVASNSEGLIFQRTLDVDEPAAADPETAKSLLVYDAGGGGNLLFTRLFAEPGVQFGADEVRRARFRVGALRIALGSGTSTISDHLRQRIFNLLLSATGDTPGALYATFFRGNPLADGASEYVPIGVRVRPVLDAAWWTGAAAGEGGGSTGKYVYSTPISAQRVGTYQVCDHIALFDAASGGNLLLASPLPYDYVLQPDTTYSYVAPAGMLRVDFT